MFFNAVIFTGLVAGLVSSDSACGPPSVVTVTVNAPAVTKTLAQSVDSSPLVPTASIIPTQAGAIFDSPNDVPATLTSTSFLTNTKLINAADIQDPGLPQDGSFSFAEVDGTTSWVGGKTPNRSAELVTNTRVVTLQPQPVKNPSTTAPASVQNLLASDGETTISYTTISTTSYYTHHLTAALPSQPAQSSSPVPNLSPYLGHKGWNTTLTTSVLQLNAWPTYTAAWATSVKPVPVASLEANRKQARQVGVMITATINGVVVSWINNYGGEQAAPKPTTTAAQTIAATSPQAPSLSPSLSAAVLTPIAVSPASPQSSPEPLSAPDSTEISSSTLSAADLSATTSGEATVPQTSSLPASLSAALSTSVATNLPSLQSSSLPATLEPSSILLSTDAASSTFAVAEASATTLPAGTPIQTSSLPASLSATVSLPIAITSTSLQSNPIPTTDESPSTLLSNATDTSAAATIPQTLSLPISSVTAVSPTTATSQPAPQLSLIPTTNKPSFSTGPIVEATTEPTALFSNATQTSSEAPFSIPTVAATNPIAPSLNASQTNPAVSPTIPIVEATTEPTALFSNTAQTTSEASATFPIVEATTEPTALFPNATHSTSAASATATPCGGDTGRFTINFDDLPHFSAGPNNTDIPPIFNPYRKLFFNAGYGYVPPPSDPYAPISPPQLAVWNKYNDSVIQQSIDAGLELKGEIGAGPRIQDSAYWIDAYSVWIGCANSGPTQCQVDFIGFDAFNAGIAQQTMMQPPCPGLVNCKLMHVDFFPQFRDLAGLQIRAYVNKTPVTFYMDDLSLGWSNNTCAAQTERSSAE
ncbi:MAG: hypothetical protein Q9218_002864 [Villophora microphyllina]